ncbi:MAG: phosphatidate cytidylyltransferase [Gammaproteobacteria bacterium]|nr:MAG: phosphatidate cytidylyltransferase [Gammaproteobacteria bacterium]
MSIFLVIAAWEWARLATINSNIARIIYSSLIAVILFLTWRQLANTGFVYSVLAIGVTWWGYLFICIILSKYHHITTQRSDLIQAITGGLIGLLILMPAWQGLLLLHSSYGREYVLLVLALVWGTDTGAYIFGKRFGKHKMAPAISPGKTWEGVFGGMLTGIIVVLVAGRILALNITDSMILLLLAIIMIIFSIVGDLAISIFKRSRGLKDSGNIIPGHGGTLDRIDSLLAAFPVFVSGFIIVGHMF